MLLYSTNTDDVSYNLLIHYHNLKLKLRLIRFVVDLLYNKSTTTRNRTKWSLSLVVLSL